MKFTKIIAAALALLCGSAMLPKATVGAEEVLLDSGIDYTESTETLGNPGAGYSSGVAVNCKPNDTKVYNPTASLVVLFVDIGGFSSGANGTTVGAGHVRPGGVPVSGVCGEVQGRACPAPTCAAYGSRPLPSA